MLPTRSALLSAALVLSLGVTGSALLAQPGGWGGGSRSSINREGKVEVTRFRAEGDAALALAHGPISVVAMRADEAEGDDSAAAFPLSATYEAAVEDQLVHSGYDTARAAQTGQIAEVRGDPY